MSEIIGVGSNTWTIHHKFNNTLDKELRFANSTSVFHVCVQLHDSHTQNVSMVLTVSTEYPLPYTIDYKINLRGRNFDGKLTETKNESSRLYCAGASHVVISLELKSDVGITSVGGSFIPLVADLKSYIERGPTVTLVGSDGNVSLPRRILKLRSKALEVMFGHNSKEKLTGQIELRDFDAKTLKAFAYFLMTGQITDGKQTALGLILLGDKYDIQVMKSAAENFVKKNIAQMDEDDVIEIFYKVGRKSLYGAMVSAWSKE